MENNKDNRSRAERHTLAVVLLSLVVMILEIVIGYIAGSMALLANGIHMGGHVIAFSLTLGAYVLVRRLKRSNSTRYSGERILDLAAFASAMMLLIFAVLVGIESVEQLINGTEIHHYGEAIAIAAVGLVVNLTCARLLHFKHGEGDNNSRSAFLHVASDALSCFGTIVGLVCAMLWHITWIDSAVAILFAVVVVRWALGLLSTTARRLSRQ